MCLLFVTAIQPTMFAGRRHTMSAFQVISDISLIIINVWNVNTTCQLLPKLTSYYVLTIC